MSIRKRPRIKQAIFAPEKSLIASHVLRVDVKRGQLAVKLKSLHKNQNPRGHERKTGAEWSSSPIEDDGSDDHLGEPGATANLGQCHHEKAADRDRNH